MRLSCFCVVFHLQSPEIEEGTIPAVVQVKHVGGKFPPFQYCDYPDPVLIQLNFITDKPRRKPGIQNGFDSMKQLPMFTDFFFMRGYSVQTALHTAGHKDPEVDEAFEFISAESPVIAPNQE